MAVVPFVASLFPPTPEKLVQFFQQLSDMVVTFMQTTFEFAVGIAKIAV